MNHRALLLGLVLLLSACGSSKTMYQQVEETLEQKGGFNITQVVNDYDDTKECAAKDKTGKCTKYKKGKKFEGYTGLATLKRGDKSCTLYLDVDKNGKSWTLDAVGDQDELIELPGSPTQKQVNDFIDTYNPAKPAEEQVC